MITLVADGAYSQKSMFGGWACIVVEGTKETELHGWATNTTNNRMELQAVIEGFRYILREYDKPMPVTVISDSSYLINSMKRGWAVKWSKNGWLNGSGSPAVNRDLWETLLELDAVFSVKWKHIKGHTRHALNSRADYLAVKARTDAHAALTEAIQ